MTTRSMLNFGLRSALNAATSSSLTSGLRGAGVAPNLRIAKNATTNSTPLGNSMRDAIAGDYALGGKIASKSCGKSVELRPREFVLAAKQRRFRAEAARVGFDGADEVRLFSHGEIVSLNLAKRSGFRYFVGATPCGRPDQGKHRGLPLPADQIFNVNALPDFARNTMARRVSGEGRLGCGIDAPLCGVAVFLG